MVSKRSEVIENGSHQNVIYKNTSDDAKLVKLALKQVFKKFDEVQKKFNFCSNFASLYAAIAKPE